MRSATVFTVIRLVSNENVVTVEMKASVRNNTTTVEEVVYLGGEEGRFECRLSVVGESSEKETGGESERVVDVP